jgi:hypothetical protein
MKFAIAAAAALLLTACGGADSPATTAETPAGETPAGPAAATQPATSAALTGPSAGRWRATVTSGGMTMPPSEICYEKQMSLEEAEAVQKSAGVECSENTHNATASGLTGHSVCKMGDTTITSDMTVVGDFTSAYTMEIRSSMDPPPPGAPNPSVTTMKMERLGDCAATP